MKSFVISLILCLSITVCSRAQSTKISEESRVLTTYMFSDPDPIPILVSNPKIYPYYKYEGYEQTAEDRAWQVVKLENDFIEVYVLPEVGGKVWGAIDKTSGQEFIYRNEVMKFRNISMRGPWTSGGIEFNFGIIGHHPSTATPVDYVLQNHADGSVSCTVGNIDLSSRTQWRVAISVHPGEAFFRTHATWYNPTDVHQSYYNWMTAAAPARDDLVFYTPGDQSLKHSGEAVPWPTDWQGRSLNVYAENNFGSSKSYHIVGSYDDYFGGYFQDLGYGFGHLGSYEEIPGQKLWLWALSRSGGIWEDLLTDTDGQYIEFQAGRLFVQYSPGSHVNPITQATFEPLCTDQWDESWFPVNTIGGISDASEKGVLHVVYAGNTLNIGVMALQAVEGQLVVMSKDQALFTQNLSLDALEVFEESIPLASDQPFTVRVEAMDLRFDNSDDSKQIDRPFKTPDDWDPTALDAIYRAGLESVKFRDFSHGAKQFDIVLDEDAYHIGALLGRADIAYRSAQNEEALEWCRKVLVQDTYHPEANFLAGNIYLDNLDYVNALECYGWAARSMAYRSAAYAAMARIYTVSRDWPQSQHYCDQALTFNQLNVPALQTQLIGAYIRKDSEQMSQSLDQLLSVDPLNHVGRWIAAGLKNEEILNAHRSEMPSQTLLELAMILRQHDLNQEAAEVLDEGPDNWLTHLWKDYLDNRTLDNLNKTLDMPTDVLFPYRKESLRLLEYAASMSDHWKLDYWLGLNYWGLNRVKEAQKCFAQVGERADDPYFYITRAKLSKDTYNVEKDLRKALRLAPDHWRTEHELIEFLLNEGQGQQALDLSTKVVQNHPKNYQLIMDHIRALVAQDDLNQADEWLQKVQVLPFEGASYGRRMYAKVKLNLALRALKDEDLAKAEQYVQEAKQWPENLGVGKPFDPDERVEDYLLGVIYQARNESSKASEAMDRIIAYTRENLHNPGINALLAADQLMQRGEREEAFALLNTIRDRYENPEIQKLIERLPFSSWKDISLLIE